MVPKYTKGAVNLSRLHHLMKSRRCVQGRLLVSKMVVTVHTGHNSDIVIECNEAEAFCHGYHAVNQVCLLTGYQKNTQRVFFLSNIQSFFEVGNAFGTPAELIWNTGRIMNVNKRPLLRKILKVFYYVSPALCADCV